MKRAAWWVAWRMLRLAGRCLYRSGYAISGVGLRLMNTSFRLWVPTSRCRDRARGQTADPPRGEAEEGGGAPPGGFCPK